jgi:hypothetical protein
MVTSVDNDRLKIGEAQAPWGYSLAAPHADPWGRPRGLGRHLVIAAAVICPSFTTAKVTSSFIAIVQHVYQCCVQASFPGV